MRFLTLSAILAVFLASPLGAADRPVGPETGQSRVGGDGNQSREPDDSGFVPHHPDVLYARGFSGGGFAGGAEVPHHDADGTRRCVYRFGWRFCF